MNPLAALLVPLIALQAAPGELPSAGPDRSTAARIAVLINDYRAANGLPRIPLSRSLTAVAEAHVVDMAASEDGGLSFVRGRDARGLPCNAHSWSSRGGWTPVCYTEDHHYARRMWSKPAEITRGAYPGYGYEIGYQTSGIVAAENALRSWQSSSAHNAVILERGSWKGKNWQAMGVGAYGHSAFVWFGAEPDPAR
jgi:cysteine-rich secretory family protein